MLSSSTIYWFMYFKETIITFMISLSHLDCWKRIRRLLTLTKLNYPKASAARVSNYFSTPLFAFTIGANKTKLFCRHCNFQVAWSSDFLKMQHRVFCLDVFFCCQDLWHIQHLFSADRKHFNWNRAGTGSEFFGLRVASGLGTSSKYGSELAGLLKFAINPCFMSKYWVN